MVRRYLIVALLTVAGGAAAQTAPAPAPDPVAAAAPAPPRRVHRPAKPTAMEKDMHMTTHQIMMPEPGTRETPLPRQ